MVFVSDIGLEYEQCLYVIAAYIGRRRGRHVKHQIHTLVASLASAVLTVVAIAIPAKSYAAVVLKVSFTHLLALYG
jgi:hypothetical protein